MRNPDEQDPLLETYVIPGSGFGGQALAPDDNSLFGPDVTPTPDSQGVNEEDVSIDDADLVSPGGSPEFDHSLRRLKKPAVGQTDS